MPLKPDHNHQNICPCCHTPIVIPQFAECAIVVYTCPQCDEFLMLYNNDIHHLHKKAIMSIDLSKLQRHIVQCLERELPRYLSRAMGGPLQTEENLHLTLLMNDMADTVEFYPECDDSSAEEDPITQEEISAFKEYLKWFKMPRNGRIFY